MVYHDGSLKDACMILRETWLGTSCNAHFFGRSGMSCFERIAVTNLDDASRMTYAKQFTSSMINTPWYSIQFWLLNAVHAIVDGSDCCKVVAPFACKVDGSGPSNLDGRTLFDMRYISLQWLPYNFHAGQKCKGAQVAQIEMCPLLIPLWVVDNLISGIIQPATNSLRRDVGDGWKPV